MCVLCTYTLNHQNHKTAEACRDLWGPSGPTSLHKQGHPELVAHNHVQAGFEDLQKWRRPHTISQPLWAPVKRVWLRPLCTLSLATCREPLLPAEQTQRSQSRLGEVLPSPQFILTHRAQLSRRQTSVCGALTAPASRSEHPAQLHALPAAAPVSSAPGVRPEEAPLLRPVQLPSRLSPVLPAAGHGPLAAPTAGDGNTNSGQVLAPRSPLRSPAPPTLRGRSCCSGETGTTLFAHLDAAHSPAEAATRSGCGSS